MNGRCGEEELAVLIERSAELKRDLVDFACSPRLERSLAAAMLKAGLQEAEEADAIGTIDRFALQYRFRTVHLPALGRLLQCRFELLPTGQRPHFTVRLQSADDFELDRLLAALGAAQPNSQYARGMIWREEG